MSADGGVGMLALVARHRLTCGVCGQRDCLGHDPEYERNEHAQLEKRVVELREEWESSGDDLDAHRECLQAEAELRHWLEVTPRPIYRGPPRCLNCGTTDWKHPRLRDLLWFWMVRRGGLLIALALVTAYLLVLR